MPIIVGPEAGVSDQLARLLCTVVPAGLEEFFEEIGEPVGAGAFLPSPLMDPESMEKLKAFILLFFHLLISPFF
jgi:hypothetical protein